MDSLTVLEHKAEPLPLHVVHGEEEFLRRQVVAAICRRALGDADPTFAMSRYAGDRAFRPLRRGR